jgi:hypothetical protein
MKDTPDDAIGGRADNDTNNADDANTDDMVDEAIAGTHLILVNRITHALRHVSRGTTPAADAGDKALAAVLALRFVRRDLRTLQDQLDWLCAEVMANAVGL